MKTLWLSRIRLALMGAFLLTSVILLTMFNADKPRIMIIHSMSNESSWTAAVDHGFDQVLARNRLPVVVLREYLNLDILSEGTNLQSYSSDVRHRIDRLDPDILIAVDDETSDLIARHYVNKGHPKIVFTSLIHHPERYGYSLESGVSGIQEELPLNGIGELLEQVFPSHTLKIAVLGMSDLTGKAEMAQILKHDWKRHRIVRYALVQDFGSWKSFVQDSAKEADLLLVLSADKVPAKANGHQMMAESEVIAWTELNAQALPLGIRASYVSHGGGMAVSPSPSQLGVMAMKLALEQATQPKHTWAPRHQRSVAYEVSLRPSALFRRGVELPSIYIEAARGAGRLYE